jgi:hypothetical protein
MLMTTKSTFKLRLSLYHCFFDHGLNYTTAGIKYVLHCQSDLAGPWYLSMLSAAAWSLLPRYDPPHIRSQVQDHHTKGKKAN